MKTAELQSVVSTFREIKSCAESQWQELCNSGKSVIMVGAGTCGRAAGALEILRAIRNEIKKQQLDCPVVEVGCMGEISPYSRV